MKKLYLFLLSVLVFAAWTAAQDCGEYHKKGDCIMDKQRGWKVYSQSKSSVISLSEPVTLKVVFYGQKNYILSFCASQHLYPVHFRLLDPDTGDVLYDNANDRYIGSLEVGFDVTRSLLIDIDVLVRTAPDEEQKSEPGCLGLLIQYDNY